jgi:hypothetical protein
LVRSLLVKLFILAFLAVLLLPALLYLTSPWWGPEAVHWAAARFWQADLRPATVTVNPFQLRIEGAGGTFEGPPAPGFAAAGDLSRFRLEMEALPFLLKRRIKSASLDLATLTVTVTDGQSTLPQSGPAPPAAPAPAPAAMPVPDTRRATSAETWTIDELTLHIERGVIHYSEGGRRGEVSMDIDLNATFQGVRSGDDLTRKVLEDMMSKAAYGFLTERLFR